MSKYLRYAIMIVLLIGICSACKHKTTTTQTTTTTKQKMHVEKYYWEDSQSCPKGYPIEVYEGGYEAADGGYVSLTPTMLTGRTYWGHASGGMSSGTFSIPNRLNVIWLSYAEGCMYHVDAALDYDKMVKLFNEGYSDMRRDGSNLHIDYHYIVTGFAPGGFVVVWLAGPGKQVEIGCFQGEKTKISDQEIASLDSHDHLIFEQSRYDDVMTRFGAKGSIPYGVWSSYRKKYAWKPSFIIQDDGVLNPHNTVGFSMFNGEADFLFPSSFPFENFELRAIPNGIGFMWKDKHGQMYGGNCDFDEKSIFNAFKEVYGDDSDNQTATLEIRINKINTFFTVMLVGNNKRIFIKTEKLEAFKSRMK